MISKVLLENVRSPSCAKSKHGKRFLYLTGPKSKRLRRRNMRVAWGIQGKDSQESEAESRTEGTAIA